MKSAFTVALAVATVTVAAGATAQLFDVAAMEKWDKVEIVHYEVVGEFRKKQVQIPPTDADLYADVTERVVINFDWNKRKKMLVGTPRIRNEPGTTANIVGIDKKCRKGKINGPYEHFDVDSVRQPKSGEHLELVGRRIHPETLVAEQCGSSLRLYKGAVKPVIESIVAIDPNMLAMAKMMPPGGPFTLSADGKSVSMKAQNSDWVWTYTPTAK